MGMRICLGCLREVTDETSRCPLCSFSLKDPVDKNVLQPKSILNKRYVVGKALQIDGEGITYIGFDADYKDAVVIREYFPSSISSRQGKEIIVNEGKIATFKSLKSEFIELHSSLANLNGISIIANTRQIFEENSTVYATCDYIRAKTLSDYLKDNSGELEWYQVSRMFKPFIEDLLKINKSGHIHRGISINTILIDEHENLKLIDFKTCSARVLDTEITSNVEDGYAAPEQYKVLPNGEWTDVYGVSAVLYRVLTGTRPPNAPTRSVNDNLIEPYKLNDAIPDNVSNTIMEGLRYDPKERITNLEQFMIYLYTDNMSSTNVISNTNPLYNPYETQQKQEDTKKGFINSLFDETEEEYKENDDKQKPLLVKVLLWCIPVIIVLSLILYQLLVGFPFFSSDKDKNDNSDSSSMISDESSLSSEESSEKESSKEQSSAIQSQESSQQGTKLENFLGMDYNNITQYTSMFSFGEPSYVYSDTYAEGQICAQSVPAGTYVTVDQIIVLSVSKGPRYLTLPIAENRTAEQYQQYLKENYDIDSTIVDEYNATVQVGNVIDTFPKAGSKIDRSSDTIIKIYRSKGPQPQSSTPTTNNNTSNTQTQ